MAPADDSRNGCPFPAGSAAAENWFEAIERQRLLAGFGRLVYDVNNSAPKPTRHGRRPGPNRYPRLAGLACPGCAMEVYQLDAAGELVCTRCGWEGRTDEPDEAD